MALSELRRFVKRARRGFAPTGVILMYHRIAEPDSDPWSLAVTPEHFAEHLGVLDELGGVVPLLDMGVALADGSLHGGAIAITFDDGYADNLHVAKPLLDRHGLPATVFVTSGGVGREREFWWDELEHIVLTPDVLPARCVLPAGATEFSWDLKAGAYYTPSEREGDRGIDPWEATSDTRMAFYYALWELLRPLPAAQQETALDRLADWAAVDSTPRRSHRTLTPDELRDLARDDVIEVGGHTVRHPALAAHPEAIQREEIHRSKCDLESWLGTEVTSCSYPFGSHSPTTVELVREAGFGIACTTSQGVVWRGSDPLRLPRFEVRDWDGDIFRAKLEGWLRS